MSNGLAGRPLAARRVHGQPRPGALTAFGRALREPVGRIHRAGTVTADVSMGYLDGAIQAGKRVAGDCVARLELRERVG